MQGFGFQKVEIHFIGKQLSNSAIAGPVVDPEALVGSLTGQRWVKEKVRELSIPSQSSVPSTILQMKTKVCV